MGRHECDVTFSNPCPTCGFPPAGAHTNEKEAQMLALEDEQEG